MFSVLSSENCREAGITRVVGRLLAAAGLVIALAASAAAGRSLSPRLRLVRPAPLTVSGQSFKPSERVRLVLSATQVSRKRTVRATSGGSFVASFSITLGRCNGFTVRATGSGGSKALLKRPPLPACLPA
jgi:hypothetical protein